MAAIEFQDVHFSYAEDVKVFSDVSFSVEENEFAVVVGPNGGGKSTLMKLILGLLHPNRGEVKIFGKSPAQCSSLMGYMPQHLFSDISFPVSVLDVVLMGALTSRPGMFYAREQKAKAKQLLEKLGIGNLAHRSFSDLSGGQRQRVMIGRALISDPSLLLMDEPAAGLDPGSAQNLYELLNELNENLTIIMVSHDVDYVTRFVSRVICVSNGVALHPIGELCHHDFEQNITGMMRVDHGTMLES